MPKAKKEQKGKKKEIKIKPKELSKKASILIIISSVLLFLQGILNTSILFLRNSVILTLEKEGIAIPANIQSTITIWGFFGIAWIIMSILMFLSNMKIKKTSYKSWIWFLFVLSLLTLLSGAGMYVTGILALVGSAMYLAEKNRE